MSNLTPQERDRMMKCHKALDYLHKKEADAIRAIVDMIKREIDPIEAREIKSFHDLPYHMLDEEIHEEVKKVAEGVILDLNVLNEFLDILDEHTTPPRRR